MSHDDGAGSIVRDRYGVAHVRAPDPYALARLQGRAIAEDRAWQVEHARHRALGTTAAHLGTDAVDHDGFARSARLADTARRAYDLLDAASQDFLAAYAEGVADGLPVGAARAPEFARLDLRPGAWEPWTPIAVWLGIHVLFAGFPAKLWRERVLERLGSDGAALLHVEDPTAAASNGWLVTPGRTRTGGAVIAGDPHRVIEAPGVYQQVHLSCPDFTAFGLSVPGVPGLPHFGHAGDVAWAITNAAADYQDLYVEELRSVDGRLEARTPDGWAPVDHHDETVAVADADPVGVTVRETARGTVILDLPDGRALSLRQPTRVLALAGEAACGMDALLPLLRARTVADVDAALGPWVEPVNVVLAADRSGGTLHRTAGRVPVRHHTNRIRPVPAWEETYAWTGWADTQRAQVDGVAVMANEAGLAASLGVSFAAPPRADRIRTLLEERDDWDADAMAGVHTDVLLAPAVTLQARLADLEVADAAAAGVRDELLSWDRRMTADSTPAGRFAQVRAAFVRLLAAALAERADLDRSAELPRMYAPWVTPLPRLGYVVEAVWRDGLPGVDVDELLREALAAAAVEPATPWGDLHRLAPVHAASPTPGDPELGGDLSEPAGDATSLDLAGDNDCVLATSSVHGVDHRCWRGPVARYAFDLADPAASRWVVPLGTSGDPADPHHHDQLPAWRTGRLLPTHP